MIKIGITGQKGFIGTHLYNTIGLNPDKFKLIEFKRSFFRNPEALDSFVLECDVIVHLAALNRHNDAELIYKTNMELVQNLVYSLERTNSKPHVLISSSIQEWRDNLYGKSKKEGRELLSTWANKADATFTGLIIPNVFGPFGEPYYNSVIATFSHQIANGQRPNILVDEDLKLIYIGELIEEIINVVDNNENNEFRIVRCTSEIKVSELLTLLQYFNEEYLVKGVIPVLRNSFELNLFNSFRCYMDIKNHFPVELKQNRDSRGEFVEISRLGIGGQVSFSKTVPGITRGDHFHTRKIERFTVIKGKALIQLRRVGTDEVFDFYLDGDQPAYVDIPIWYTHNIKNIGEDTLYTIFWINESYNPENADTYFLDVKI